MLVYTHRFLASLVFTIALETSVLLVLVRKYFRLNEKVISSARLVFAGSFASFSTIAYVWYVFPVLFYSSHQRAILIGELFAFLVEALFYEIFLGLGAKRSLAISLIANAASFTAEYFLIRLFA